MNPVDDYCSVVATLENGLEPLLRLAKVALEVPHALVAIVERDRAWFRSNFRLESVLAAPDATLSAEVFRARGAWFVADARADARFASQPAVSAEPGARFYAGVPLTTQRGHVVGALCVLDHVPRQLSAVQVEILELCALQLVATFESRRKERHFADERESLEIHRQFFDLSPVLLCTIDEHLAFRELSPGWEEALGWKRALLRARDLSELVHPDDVERTRAELRRVAGEGIRRRNFEMRMKHEDGHWVPLSWAWTGRGGIVFAAAKDMSAHDALVALLQQKNE